MSWGSAESSPRLSQAAKAVRSRRYAAKVLAARPFCSHRLSRWASIAATGAGAPPPAMRYTFSLMRAARPDRLRR